MNSEGYSMWITVDYIMLILVPSILGLLSEIACLVVFLQIRVGSLLFAYLRAYTINNLLICGALFVQFFYTIYTLGDPRTWTIVNSYFNFPFLGLCYLNSTLLDIVILLDRISTFNERLKQWLKLISPLKQIILLALISTVLTIPYFFLYGPVEIKSTSPDGIEYTVWISGSSPLSSTRIGDTLVLLIVALDYIAVMVIQILLNICSLLYIRRHIKDKSTMVGVSQTQSSKFQNVDIKTSLMVTLLCFLSFFEHFLFISCNVGQFFFSKQINFVLLQKITFFGLGMKRFSDFFFYLKFNKVFYKKFRVMVHLPVS